MWNFEDNLSAKDKDNLSAKDKDNLSAKDIISRHTSKPERGLFILQPSD